MSTTDSPQPAPRSGPPQLSTGKKILALVVGLCLALGLGEVALRLFWHNNYAGSSADFIYRLRLENANRDYTVDRREIDAETPQVRFRTDDRSYLVPSFQFEKPDATVAFLGGSTTQCVAVQEPLRFHALVSDQLRDKGLNVNTLNGAMAGNTLHDSLNVLLNHVVNDRPDVVVVMHVTNDIGVLAPEGSYRSRMSRKQTWRDSANWLKQTLSSHVYLVGVARYALADAGARQRDVADLAWRNDPARADALPIDLYEQRLRSFIGICRAFGIQPVLMTEPLIHSTSKFSPDWADLGAQDRFNALIVKIGAEENVPVIDLVKYLHDNVADWNDDEKMVVFYDGAHVTDNGSRIYAQCISEQLEPIVRRIAEERKPQQP